MNEIKRLQQLAGILTEIKINTPNNIDYLCKQALQSLIDQDNQYTKGMKQELLDHFDSIGTDKDGITTLRDMIKQIKSGELTNYDIVYDMVDSYGGDYDGEFEGYRF